MTTGRIRLNESFGTSEGDNVAAETILGSDVVSGDNMGGELIAGEDDIVLVICSVLFSSEWLLSKSVGDFVSNVPNIFIRSEGDNISAIEAFLTMLFSTIFASTVPFVSEYLLTGAVVCTDAIGGTGRGALTTGDFTKGTFG